MYHSADPMKLKHQWYMPFPKLLTLKMLYLLGSMLDDRMISPWDFPALPQPP